MLSTPQLLIGISASFSAVACIGMMVCFLAFEECRRCGRRILFYMNLTDLLGAGMWLLTLWPSIAQPELESSTPVECFLQGYGLQFCMVSSYLWTSCFAFHLYQILVKNNKTPEMYEWRYILLSWGVPLFILLMFGVEHLCGFVLIGFGGLPWCWIRAWSDNQWAVDGYVFQMIFFYGPLTIALSYNMIIFVAIASKLGQSSVMSTGMEDKIRRRMMAYTIVFLLTFSWGGLGRTFQVISPEHELSPVFLALTSFFTPLQGFLNCLTYGLNKLLRDRIRHTFKTWYTSSHQSHSNSNTSCQSRSSNKLPSTCERKKLIKRVRHE